MFETQPEFTHFTCAGCQKRFRVRAGKPPREFCADCRRVESQISASRSEASVEELASAVRAEQIANAEKRAAEASRRVQEEQSRGLAMVFKPAGVEDVLEDAPVAEEALDAPVQPELSVFKPVPTWPPAEKRAPSEEEEEVPAVADAYSKSRGPSPSGNAAAFGQVVVSLGLAGVVIGALGAFFSPWIAAGVGAILLWGELNFRLSKIERRLREILHEMRAQKRD
jgi:hypothetical protein